MTPRWIIVIDPPKGQLLFYLHFSYGTIVIRESYKKGDPEGVFISALSNGPPCKRDGNMKFSPEAGMVDVDAHRDVWLADEGVRFREISDARSMGFRTIGGEYATDSVYILTTDKGEVYAYQLWHVRRPEGMWNFHICSTPRGTDIAPGLLTALETTRRADAPPTFSCSKAEDSNYPC